MMHYPVMLPDVLSALSAKAGEIYIDGTFGNGGYSEAFLKEAECRVIGLDQDPNVATAAAALKTTYGARFDLIRTPFSKMDSVLPVEQVDAVILDIGVSSMQIDRAERGFSFMRAGPLDMRMSQSGPTAADAVNILPEKDLIRIFQIYGEEKRSRRAAQSIIEARENSLITTTDELANIIEKAFGRTGKIHPATRVFQALRIFVNDELGELYRGLCAAEEILRPGGRLIVVSFHSLEDRIAKKFIRRRSEKKPVGSRYMPAQEEAAFSPSFDTPKRSAVLPSDAEVVDNVRSRSARMRWAVRTEAPAFDRDETLLPRAPQIHDYKWAA